MKVAKWGNSLAVRLPAELVAELGLSDGDEIEIVKACRARLEVERRLTVEDAMERLKQYRGRLPADFKFDRDEANSRGRDE